MAVESLKTTLVVGYRYFLELQNREKILRNFQSPPPFFFFFFHLFPLATALTREMSYSPKRRLIRDGVTS